jgi:hypothetical protein
MRTRTLLLAILLVLAGVSLSGQRCFALVAWDKNAHSQLSTSNSSPPLLAMGARGKTTAPTVGGINRDHFSLLLILVLIACLAGFVRLASGNSQPRRELHRVSGRRLSVGELSCLAVVRERGPDHATGTGALTVPQRTVLGVATRTPAVANLAASAPLAASTVPAGRGNIRAKRQEDSVPVTAAEEPPFCRVVAPLEIL